jgi:hypothetical protein
MHTTAVVLCSLDSVSIDWKIVKTVSTELQSISFWKPVPVSWRRDTPRFFGTCFLLEILFSTVFFFNSFRSHKVKAVNSVIPSAISIFLFRGQKLRVCDYFNEKNWRNFWYISEFWYNFLVLLLLLYNTGNYFCNILESHLQGNEVLLLIT